MDSSESTTGREEVMGVSCQLAPERVGTTRIAPLSSQSVELQVTLEQNRATMDTATVRVLESSLAKIDAALAEAQRALAQDPSSEYLNDHLSRIKRKKLDLLRQGAALVQAS